MRNELKDRIKCIRNYLDLSRREFARKLSISEATIRRWESGLAKRLYPLTIKNLISSLLNIDIICDREWIINGTGNNPKRIINAKQEIYEDIILLTRNHSLFNCINFEILARYNHKFFSYMNSQEILIWINEDCYYSFNFLRRKVIGKHFREIFGNEFYSYCKLYIDKAFQGIETSFEVKWKYDNVIDCHSNVTYIPNKIDDKIIGIYIFAEEIRKKNRPHNVKKKNINKIFPKLSTESVKKISTNDYILSLKKVEKILLQYNVCYDIDDILKISYHVYCYMNIYGLLDENYIHHIITLALKHGYLMFNDY